MWENEIAKKNEVNIDLPLFFSEKVLLVFLFFFSSRYLDFTIEVMILLGYLLFADTHSLSLSLCSRRNKRRERDMTTRNDERETRREKKASFQLCYSSSLGLLLSSTRANYRFLLCFAILMTNWEHTFMCLKTSFPFFFLFSSLSLPLPYYHHHWNNNMNKVYPSMHRLMSKLFVSRVLHLNFLSSSNKYTHTHSCNDQSISAWIVYEHEKQYKGNLFDNNNEDIWCILASKKKEKMKMMMRVKEKKKKELLSNDAVDR